MADIENFESSSPENNSESSVKKSSIAGIVAACCCLLFEVISIICTYFFAMQYDESEGTAARVSLGLMSCALIGQLFGCCLTGYVANAGKTVSNECNCEEICGITIYLVGILSILPSGFGQLGSTIAMIVATANNAAGNVIAFGVFICVIDALAVATSIPYLVLVYWPACTSFID